MRWAWLGAWVFVTCGTYLRLSALGDAAPLFGALFLGVTVYLPLCLLWWAATR